MRIDERLGRPMAHQYCEDACELLSLSENADGQVRRARSQIPGQDGVGRRNGQYPILRHNGSLMTVRRPSALSRHIHVRSSPAETAENPSPWRHG